MGARVFWSTKFAFFNINCSQEHLTIITSSFFFKLQSYKFKVLLFLLYVNMQLNGNVKEQTKQIYF